MAQESTSPRVLIVYYSRSGNTESVARGLARASGADVEELVAMRDRGGLSGYLLSGYEALRGHEGRIQPPRRNPKDYDLVLIGTPTWAASLASPVRTYLDRYAAVLPEVGFFVTCGGGGSERVLEQMQSIAGKMPLAALTLSERDLQRHASVYVGEFLEKALTAWEAQKARLLEFPRLRNGASFGVM